MNDYSECEVANCVGMIVGQFRDCPPLPGILDDGTTTGQGAEAVYHDKITGACISKDDYYISKQKKLEPKLELEWGKGLAQKREAQARPEELELEKDKPFACTRSHYRKYEQQMFKKTNEKQAIEGEAYLCSVSDMSGCDPEPFVLTSLISMYCKCALIDSARKVFNENTQSMKLSICYNALLSGKRVDYLNEMIFGYAQNGLASQVLELYREMKTCGVFPDAVTVVGVLSSVAHLGARSVGCAVEQQIAANGFGRNPFLSNALINMYSRCGNLKKARAIFDRMPVKSVVSWTAIIGGYGMHGQGEVAVQLFDEMIRIGVRPDSTAFVSVLSACSHAGPSDKGSNYFAAMEKKYGLQLGPEHYSCMVDLLGRAGRLCCIVQLTDPLETFLLPSKKCWSWTIRHWKKKL
ncbi:hypothetical protein QYF36_023307 [Acer negundo]|nr:hypothetical protein QYF36_023307 [Acer negundo]